MKRLIFQICLGKNKDSKLYEHCINSVSKYCDKYGITHQVLRQPVLKIRPDPFSGNRSTESYVKHGGYLPIYEKEAAFDLLKDYDQIAILDSDIYVKETSPNIFEEFGTEYAWGGVVEREMPLTENYCYKIRNYSMMQYGILNSKKIDFKYNNLGYEFYNMGLILINTSKFMPFLEGQSARDFLLRFEFRDFIDGIGNWKWSTDQTLLNYFLKKYNIPTKHLDWKWNGLYTANTKIDECHFIHFFMKDKLPSGGENVEELMRKIL